MFSDFIKSMEKIIKLEQKYHNSIGLRQKFKLFLDLYYRCVKMHLLIIISSKRNMSKLTIIIGTLKTALEGWYNDKHRNGVYM